MSMVHRQRAVLLQFPLVIYLAALLKCSCCWHWLTNQTVKLHPEYQCTRRFKTLVYHLFLDKIPKKSTWQNWLLGCGSPGFSQPKSIKAKKTQLWLMGCHFSFIYLFVLAQKMIFRASCPHTLPLSVKFTFLLVSFVRSVLTLLALGFCRHMRLEHIYMRVWQQLII